MITTNTAFKQNFDDSEYDDRVIYQYSISPGRVTDGNTTTSLLDFSKAETIKNEINPALVEAQGSVWSALQQMISSLKEGERPSIEIAINDMNEAQKEDLFWIKASQTSSTE